MKAKLENWMKFLWNLEDVFFILAKIKHLILWEFFFFFYDKNNMAVVCHVPAKRVGL